MTLKAAKHAETQALLGALSRTSADGVPDIYIVPMNGTNGVEIDIKPAKHMFADSKQLADDISELLTPHLPNNAYDMIINGLKMLLGASSRLDQLKSGKFNKESVDSIIDGMRDASDTFYFACGPVLSIERLRSAGFTKIEAIAEGVKKRFEEQTAKLEEKVKIADALVLKIRELAPDAGSAVQAEQFTRMADSHKSAAALWLTTTGLIGILILVFGYLLLESLGKSITGTAADAHIALIREISYRIIFVSVSFFALTWASRNYRTHRHNEVVNRHRAAALRTFQTFVGGTEDPATKNAILLHSVEAVFGAQPSGYLTTEAETPPQSTLIELVRKYTTDRP